MKNGRGNSKPATKTDKSSTPRTNNLNTKTKPANSKAKSTAEENYISKSQDLLKQQTEVLTKMEGIASKLVSPRTEENVEIDKDKIIEKLKEELRNQKDENQKLKLSNESLLLKNEQFLNLENRLNSLKLTFSDQATELMENLKIVNPKYVKNYTILNPNFIDDHQITVFFKDIIYNMKNINSNMFDEIQFYKRENFRLEDEVISLQKRASETQLVQSDLEFYKRLYHTNLRTNNEMNTPRVFLNDRLNNSSREFYSNNYERNLLTSSNSKVKTHKVYDGYYNKYTDA